MATRPSSRRRIPVEPTRDAPCRRLALSRSRTRRAGGIAFLLLGCVGLGYAVIAAMSPNAAADPLHAVDGRDVAARVVEASFAPSPLAPPSPFDFAPDLPAGETVALTLDVPASPHDGNEDGFAPPAPSSDLPPEARAVITRARARHDHPASRPGSVPALWSADVDVAAEFLDPVAARVAPGDLVAFPLPVTGPEVMQSLPVRIRRVDTDVNRVTTLVGEVDGRAADLFLLATDGERLFAVYKSPLGQRTYAVAWNPSEQRHVYTAFNADAFPRGACAHASAAGVSPAETDAPHARPSRPRASFDADASIAMLPESTRRAWAALPTDPTVHVDVTPRPGETASSVAIRNAEYEHLLAGPLDTDALRAAASATDASSVDVLAVYDARAAEAMIESAGSAELELAVQIAQANWIFVRSGFTGASLRLVASHRVGVPGAFADAITVPLLEAMEARNDGVLDELHVLRDAYGADLVSLFINPDYTGGYVTTGYAYLPTGSDTDAFSAVWFRFCDSRGPEFTWPHEIGHNFGAHHARESDASVTHAYAAGHWWKHPKAAEGGVYIQHNYRVDQNPAALPGPATTTAAVGTVMTYEKEDATGNALSLPYFSNPRLQVHFDPDGATPYTNLAHTVALGTTVRDNVRAMGVHAPDLRAYRTGRTYNPALPIGEAVVGVTSTTRRYYYVDVPPGARLVTFSVASSTPANILDIGLNGPARGIWAPRRIDAEMQQATAAFGEGHSIADPEPGRYFLTVERTAAGATGAGYIVQVTLDGHAATPGTPTFTPGGGIHTGPLTVTLDGAGAARIYYTTDGTPPSPTNGLAVTPGATIILTTSCTLNAVAVNADGVAGTTASADYTITTGTVGTPGTPTFSPDGGSYRGPVTITLNGTNASIIRYTLDGTTPTATHGLLATPGQTITLTGSGVLKAVGVNSAGVAGPVKTASYTLTVAPALTPYTPTFNPDGGAYVDHVVVTLYGVNASTIRYTTNGDDPMSASGITVLPGDKITIPSSCVLKAVGVNIAGVPGPVKTSTYAITSSGVLPETPTFNPDGGGYVGYVDITLNSRYAVAIRYTTNGEDPFTSPAAITVLPGEIIRLYTTCVLKAVGIGRHGDPGATKSSTYTIAPYEPTHTVPWTPTFTPDGGGYVAYVNVRIDCRYATLIRYTTNGDDPMSPSALTILPGETVTLTSNCVLKAVGLNAYGIPGATKSSTYAISPAGTSHTYPGMPTYNPDGGGYASYVTVTLNCTNAVVILYTTNGEDPAAGNGIAITPGERITLTHSCTLKAVGINRYGIVGPVKTSTYAISSIYVRPGTPSFAPSGGVFPQATAVVPSAANAASFRYTTDGSLPTATHGATLAPGQAVTLADSGVLRMVAVSAGGVAGSENAAYFTIGHGGESAEGWRVAVVGDFDGDGKADVLWRHAATGRTRIFFMRGTTVASQADTSKQVGAAWTVQGAGDFNGDGADDILWRDTAGRTYIWFMQGATVRSTSAYTSRGVGNDWTVEGVGDFDGNGRADILWRHTDGRTHVWRMNGATVTDASAYTSKTVGSAWTIRGVGDFDGDGKADVLWRHAGGATYVWFMDGATVKSASNYTTKIVGVLWTVAGVGDFDGDGQDDILWRHTNGATYVWFMDGVSVSPASDYTSQRAGADQVFAGTGDCNGDGADDILWTQPASGHLTVWLMDRLSVSATSGAASAQMTPEWRVAGAGDFDGDGNDDILWRHADGTTRLWLMDGATVKSDSANTSRQVGTPWRIVGVGDFDGDGQDDPLWRHTNGATHVWLMNGTAVKSASAYTTRSVGFQWTVEGVGDFNGDGRDDVLWRHANGATYLWFMNGVSVGAASAYTSKTVGWDWTVEGVGDFNGDGRDDILWRHKNGATYLWFMEGTTVSSASDYTAKTVGRDWTVSGVADFDGDGRADLLWRNTAGHTYLWLMNGRALKKEGYTSRRQGMDWGIEAVGRGMVFWRERAAHTSMVWTQRGLDTTTAASTTQQAR